MIDIKRELGKYKPIAVGQDIKYDDQILNLLDSFNSTVERIGKDQYRTLNHMNDIMEVLEENSGLEKLIEGMEGKINSLEEEQKKLLEVIMELCDLTENMYIFSVESQNQKLEEQMGIQLKGLQQSLLQCGITRFGSKKDIFSRQLHTAVKVEKADELPDGEILNVIKSGYIYKNQLLKKAEVVVNCKSSESM